jgi:site-specific DNA recombinase
LTRCFGFRSNGTLDLPEAEILSEVARRYLAGESLHSLVRDLNARGVRTSAGNPFRKESLKRLLLSDRLAGPILTDREFADITTRLREPSERTTPVTDTSKGRRYLLTGGLARCGLCGAALIAQPSNSGRRAYVCPRPSLGGCGKIRIAAEGLEDAITKKALARLASPYTRRQLAPTEAELAAVPARLADARTALDEMNRELSDRRLPVSEQRSLRKRIDKTLRTIEELSLVQTQGKRAAALLEVTPETLADWWDTASIDARHELISIVLDHIDVNRRTLPRGSNAYDSRRVKPFWRGES